jgi:hypothetical protein
LKCKRTTPKWPSPRLINRWLSADPYFLTTQFKIIESYRILTNVIANLASGRETGPAKRRHPLDIDDTFDYLVHRLSVEQTRMTSLIEISVRNQARNWPPPSPTPWPTLTSSSVWSSGRQIPKGGASPRWKKSWPAQPTNFADGRKQIGLDAHQFGYSDIYDQSVVVAGHSLQSLEDWDHQRVMAKADYLEYSNILFNLGTKCPPINWAGRCNTAYAHQLDPELVELSERLQMAKARMVEADNNYGPDMPAL